MSTMSLFLWVLFFSNQLNQISWSVLPMLNELLFIVIVFFWQFVIICLHSQEHRGRNICHVSIWNCCTPVIDWPHPPWYYIVYTVDWLIDRLCGTHHPCYRVATPSLVLYRVYGWLIDRLCSTHHPCYRVATPSLVLYRVYGWLIDRLCSTHHPCYRVATPSLVLYRVYGYTVDWTMVCLIGYLERLHSRPIRQTKCVTRYEMAKSNCLTSISVQYRHKLQQFISSLLVSDTT